MSSEAGPRVFIDADACPVRAETIKVATRHGLSVYVVSNGGIRPDPDPRVHTVVVDAGADAADMWIADRVQPSDVCVTADIPLAARVVEAGGQVLKPNGETLTQRNIGNALATRDLMADMRAANPLSQGGGARPFARSDRSRFLDTLDRVIRMAIRARTG